jgi:aspartate/methionine/tyrosine aminotransferase
MEAEALSWYDIFMHLFSDRTAWELSPNRLSVRIKELRKTGVPLLDLTITNPTRCGLKYPDEKLLNAFVSPDNLDYAPDPHGLLSARKAVLNYYAKRNISLSPEQIFLTANTSEAYSFVFKLLANAGDSFLAPEPSYPLLDYLATLCDIRIVRYPLNHQNSWGIDWNQWEQQVVTEMPQGIIFVNPNNPTGNYLSAQDHLRLSSILTKHSFPIIADEVFLDFPLTHTVPCPVSFATRNDTLTFTLSGISKILGLPQMKLSWIVVTGPEDLRNQAMEKLEVISDTYLSVSTPVQNALPVFFSHQQAIHAEISGRIQTNYLYLKQTFHENSKMELLESEGGWAAVFKCPVNRTDDEWALELLEKESVIIHPGFFYDFQESSYLVVSLLTPPEILKAAIPRLQSRIK